MIFKECKLKGAYLIELEIKEDIRGYFARSFCKNEFIEQGLECNIVQCNISYNKEKNTLRGMHFQCAPYEECKIVSCTKGSIFDVIIDLRKESNTYLKWEAFELTEENRNMLYIPKGFAHGFQTLEDNTIVYYQMTEYYHPECAKGVLWNDTLFNIEWPIKDNIIISNNDTSYLYI